MRRPTVAYVLVALIVAVATLAFVLVLELRRTDTPQLRAVPPSSTVAVTGSLPRLDTPAIATQQARRVQPLGPVVREEVLVTSPPAPTGILGLPLAPAEFDRCQTMNFYRVQFGLPDRFSDQPRQPQVSFGQQGLGWRESNCRNEVVSSTGCCVGYWQLHHIVFRDHRTVDGMARCTATWHNVRGTDPLSQQRQACAAKVLFDAVGYQPWAL